MKKRLIFILLVFSIIFITGCAVEEVPEEIIETPEEDEPLGMLAVHECTEQEKQAEICPDNYEPVCGMVDNNIRCITAPCASTDAKTYSNGCQACAAQAFSHYQGECLDQLFVVCQDTVTGFDPVEFAEKNNGICVDICPGNYDPYMTQIGIELCIEHYGVEEIEEWKICKRSSGSCNCVKAGETTRSEQIDDAKYRCVPDIYAERLLFTSGQDKIDENGQRYASIA